MMETIQNFLWTHPWWHATGVAVLVAIPSAIALYFSWRDGVTAEEANTLRRDANRFHDEANRLREELNTATNRIGMLQEERNRLEVEKNNALAQIATNVKRPATEAELNAAKLRKYIGQTAAVSEPHGSWGGMGAQIAEVSEDNIVALFVPASYSSSSAYVAYVKGDKLQIIETPVGGCAIQIKVLERYGETILMGDAKKWGDRGTPSSAPRPRGTNAFHATYHLPGSSTRRGIYIYSPTNGNPQYTLVTMVDGVETGAMYGDHLDISKRFATMQIEWMAEGYLWNGGATNNPPERLYTFTS